MRKSAASVCVLENEVFSSRMEFIHCSVLWKSLSRGQRVCDERRTNLHQNPEGSEAETQDSALEGGRSLPKGMWTVELLPRTKQIPPSPFPIYSGYATGHHRGVLYTLGYEIAEPVQLNFWTFQMVTINLPLYPLLARIFDNCTLYG